LAAATSRLPLMTDVSAQRAMLDTVAG